MGKYTDTRRRRKIQNFFFLNFENRNNKKNYSWKGYQREKNSNLLFPYIFNLRMKWNYWIHEYWDFWFSLLGMRETFSWFGGMKQDPFCPPFWPYLVILTEIMSFSQSTTKVKSQHSHPISNIFFCSKDTSTLNVVETENFITITKKSFFLFSNSRR